MTSVAEQEWWWMKGEYCEDVEQRWGYEDIDTGSCEKFVGKWGELVPASMAEWLTHSAAMCSRALRAQWPGFDSAWARPPTKELFLIIPIPTHMMNREIITGRKKEGSMVSSIICDPCRHFDLAVLNLPAGPAWVEANRLGWPLVGVIHSSSQG